MSTTLKVTISDEEFEMVKRESARTGKSHSQTLRQLAFPDISFEKNMEVIAKKIRKLKPSTVFTLKELLGVEWKEIPKSTRLSLGRAFYQQVIAEKIPDISALETEKNKSQNYKKR